MYLKKYDEIKDAIIKATEEVKENLAVARKRFNGLSARAQDIEVLLRDLEYNRKQFASIFSILLGEKIASEEKTTRVKIPLFAALVPLRVTDGHSYPLGECVAIVRGHDICLRQNGSIGNHLLRDSADVLVTDFGKNIGIATPAQISDYVKKLVAMGVVLDSEGDLLEVGRRG